MRKQTRVHLPVEKHRGICLAAVLMRRLVRGLVQGGALDHAWVLGSFPRCLLLAVWASPASTRLGEEGAGRVVLKLASFAASCCESLLAAQTRQRLLLLLLGVVGL